MKKRKINGKVINYKPEKDLTINDLRAKSQRVKEIPEQVKQIEEHIENVKKDGSFKVSECEYRIEDFTIRLANFRVLDPKYEWEGLNEWVENQKKNLYLEIEKSKMNKEMIMKSVISTENDLRKQIVQFNQQNDRCGEDVLNDYKILKELFKMTDEQIKTELDKTIPI